MEGKGHLNSHLALESLLFPQMTARPEMSHSGVNLSNRKYTSYVSCNKIGNRDSTREQGFV